MLRKINRKKELSGDWVEVGSRVVRFSLQKSIHEEMPNDVLLVVLVAAVVVSLISF